MRYTSSSWFPLSNFTKIGCHRDWQMGVSQWRGIKDALTGSPIKPFETVFWNRSKGNLSVGLENYYAAVKSGKYEKRLKELELPKDIHL